MNMFDKLDYYIDYNNLYSIRKALTTLGREFNLASNSKNIEHAKVTVHTVLQVYNKLSQTYNENEYPMDTTSYSKKLLAQKMRKFIDYLTKRLKTEFGVSNYEQEIEQAIA